MAMRRVRRRTLNTHREAAVRSVPEVAEVGVLEGQEDVREVRQGDGRYAASELSMQGDEVGKVGGAKPRRGM